MASNSDHVLCTLNVDVALNPDSNKQETLGKPLTYYEVNGKKISAGSSELFLELEDPSKFSLSFENEYEYPLDTLLSKSKSTAGLLLEAIQAGNNIAGAAKKQAESNAKARIVGSDSYKSESVFFSKYANTPAYKNTSTLKIPDTLTFIFYFGQLGKYDCFSEVVLPIIRLASYFAPRDSGGMLSDLPFPTTPSFYAKSLSTLLKGTEQVKAPETPSEEDIEESSEEDSEESEQPSDLDRFNEESEQASGFLKVAANVINKLDSAVTSYYSPHKLCTLTFLGIKTPPFYVKKIGFSFDFSERDDNDYPLVGRFTLSEIETVKVASKEMIQKI